MFLPRPRVGAYIGNINKYLYILSFYTTLFELIKHHKLFKINVNVKLDLTSLSRPFSKENRIFREYIRFEICFNFKKTLIRSSACHHYKSRMWIAIMYWSIYVYSYYKLYIELYTTRLIYNDYTSDNNTNILSNIIWINSSVFVCLFNLWLYVYLKFIE